MTKPSREEFITLEKLAERITESNPEILWGSGLFKVCGVILDTQQIPTDDRYSYVMFGAMAKRAILLVLNEEKEGAR